MTPTPDEAAERLSLAMERGWLGEIVSVSKAHLRAILTEREGLRDALEGERSLHAATESALHDKLSAATAALAEARVVMEPFKFISEVESHEPPTKVLWGWTFGDRARFDVTLEHCNAAARWLTERET